MRWEEKETKKETKILLDGRWRDESKE